MRGLKRTKRGTTVHLANCRYAAMGKEWRWAVDQTPTRIAQVIREMGYRTCRVCNPLALHTIGGLLHEAH